LEGLPNDALSIETGVIWLVSILVSSETTADSRGMKEYFHPTLSFLKPKIDTGPVQDVDWLMERNNLSNFANHGIQVNCKRLDVIVVVSLFLSSLSLWSTSCHSSCILSLVMDTSQLQGRLDDASILVPFLGRVGMMMTTVITTMAMVLERSITGLRQGEGFGRVRKDYCATTNNLSEIYTSIQEYWLCAMRTGSEHCLSSPVKDLLK
jgi:hypothetical protein